MELKSFTPSDGQCGASLRRNWYHIETHDRHHKNSLNHGDSGPCTLSSRSTIYHNMQYICGTHRQVYVKWYLPIFWSLPLCCCIIITCSLRWPVVDELRSHNETWPILLIPDILPPTHSRYSIYVYIGWISYASFVCLVLLCRDRSHYRWQSSETMCMQFWTYIP